VTEELARSIRKHSYSRLTSPEEIGQRILLAVDVIGGRERRRAGRQGRRIPLGDNIDLLQELAESLSYDGQLEEVDAKHLLRDLVFAEIYRKALSELAAWAKAAGPAQFRWGTLTSNVRGEAELEVVPLAPATGGNPIAASRCRVLIVDDDASARESLATLVRRLGYGVVEAGSGEQGLAALDAASADLVLFDFELPATSGIEMVRRLRAERPNTPVVVISATQKSSLTDGGIAYVGKPLRADQLQDAVRSLLDRS